jgi:hypothetical protein
MNTNMQKIVAAVVAVAGVAAGFGYLKPDQAEKVTFAIAAMAAVWHPKKPRTKKAEKTS